MKICKIHGELTEKQIYISKPRGRESKTCKLCKNDYQLKNIDNIKEKMNEYYKKNKELNLIRFKKYHENNKEVRHKKHKEWCESNKARWLKSEYGIILTHENYLKLLESQNNLCAICKKPEKILSRKRDRIKSLAIDHCHKTNKIRGLLCHHCNVALGSFKDSIELLESAIEYLKTTQ